MSLESENRRLIKKVNRLARKLKEARKESESLIHPSEAIDEDFIIEVVHLLRQGGHDQMHHFGSCPECRALALLEPLVTIDSPHNDHDRWKKVNGYA